MNEEISRDVASDSVVARSALGAGAGDDERDVEAGDDERIAGDECDAGWDAMTVVKLLTRCAFFLRAMTRGAK